MTSTNIRKLSHSEMDLYRKPLLPKTWSCFPVDKDIDTQMLRKILQKDLDKIRGKYIPKKRTRLDDDVMVEEIDKIREHKKYGWLTAVVFIYGCRPNEAFSLIPQKDGIAKAVNCPKAEEKMVKFPIALGLEKDDYKSELLIERWDTVSYTHLTLPTIVSV